MQLSSQGNKTVLKPSPAEQTERLEEEQRGLSGPWQAGHVGWVERAASPGRRTLGTNRSRAAPSGGGRIGTSTRVGRGLWGARNSAFSPAWVGEPRSAGAR